jgi:hypothetical protein
MRAMDVALYNVRLDEVADRINSSSILRNVAASCCAVDEPVRSLGWRRLMIAVSRAATARVLRCADVLVPYSASARLPSKCAATCVSASPGTATVQSRQERRGCPRTVAQRKVLERA